MEDVYLLLGSNRGDRKARLAEAMKLIRELAGEPFITSGIYESEPWGFDDPTPFLNLVTGIRTPLQPGPLLELMLSIEARVGRIRSVMENICGVDPSTNPILKKAYESRIIDIDILFYGNRLVFTDQLMIPHPRLHERRFTLVPLGEIAPNLLHPVLKKSIFVLLNECTDRSVVRLVE